MSAPIQTVISALESHECKVTNSGASYSARCPAHDDRRSSLSISEGADGRALVKCHAGCETSSVVAALGLSLSDLFTTGTGARREVARYRYTDEKGAELYHVRRYDPKDFRPFRPGADAPGIKGVTRVLYRLPQVTAAAKAGDRVYVVEGEKDADALAALGLVATTAAGGAKAKWEPSYSAALRGARVVVVADKDEPGRQHAREVADALLGAAASVRVVEVPAGKDAADYIAAGAKREDFERFAEEAPEKQPVPLSVTVALANVKPERVEWLWDGRVPFGKVTLFDGDPGLGKSTLALELAARLTTGRAMPEGMVVDPTNVVILTAEDGLADTIRPRLDAAGADVSRVFALTAARETNGEETFPTLDGNLDALADAVRRHAAGLLVIDPLMAYLGGGVNSWRDQDVRRVLAPLSKLAEETGCAVVIVRHLTKGGGANAVYRGGGSIGITGAARSALLVAKDPKDEARRIIACSKSNLAAIPASVAYRIKAAGDSSRIEFDGTSDLTADGLLAAAMAEAEDRTARDEAEDFLSDLLGSGPVPTPNVQAESKKAGHSWATVRRAKDRMGIKVEKHGMAGGWAWRLPTEGAHGVSTFEDAHEPSKVLTLIERASSGEGEHLREEEAANGPLSREEQHALRVAAATLRRVVP
ncbi:MAG TPA: AAA family ATPase [Thermoanaerobaculia bacterium]|nr:AAA family ATPase [Thermoanaerobaculia bacterium]HQR66559.1 AAA family ATPase [Thermoanaerobaculia bacterium]